MSFVVHGKYPTLTTKERINGPSVGGRRKGEETLVPDDDQGKTSKKECQVAPLRTYNFMVRLMRENNASTV